MTAATASERPAAAASSTSGSGLEGAAQERLLAYRQSIDNLDAAIVHLLAERFRCTQEVGVLKARHGAPAADPSREAAQVERLRRLAVDAHLDPAFAEKFLEFVVSEVVRHHEAIASAGAPAEG